MNNVDVGRNPEGPPQGDMSEGVRRATKAPGGATAARSLGGSDKSEVNPLVYEYLFFTLV
jgi:hypothetical protein